MSSYLTFYLVPKKDKGDVKKPLAWASYSRNLGIYQAFYENMNVAYIGNDDEYNYTELTKEEVRHVVNTVKKEYEQSQKDFNLRMDAYKALPKLEGEALDNYIEDVTSTTKYLDEQKEIIIQLETIEVWIDDLEYSDFDKVLINVD